MRSLMWILALVVALWLMAAPLLIGAYHYWWPRKRLDVHHSVIRAILPRCLGEDVHVADSVDKHWGGFYDSRHSSTQQRIPHET
jgi:hypothetical protein